MNLRIGLEVRVVEEGGVFGVEVVIRIDFGGRGLCTRLGGGDRLQMVFVV